MHNSVFQIPAADPKAALGHFERRLAYEADCWDTHEALLANPHEFVLLDVRSLDLYEASHIPGAVNLPHGRIIERNLATWPEDILFVVYCAGPHCNGANKAAVRLAQLGRSVKEMVGGMTGWADEGFAFAQGKAPGGLERSKEE
ncbi:MAG: rhodanese-like domain-containing protein [Parvularcula sp.]